MSENLKIIDLLLQKGLVSQEEIIKAKQEVQRTGLILEQALQKLGFISSEDIARISAQYYGVPYMDLSDYVIDSSLVKLIPEDLARKYKVVPLFRIGSSLTVAMLNPHDVLVLDAIRDLSQMTTVEPVVSTLAGIQKILDSYYGVVGSVDEIINSIDKDKFSLGDDKNVLDGHDQAPIIKLVNLIVMQAAKKRASDIHIEPEETKVRVRYRVDGILYEEHSFEKNFHRAIVSRIKVLANLDIAETRKPQDGRIKLRLEDKSLDIRVSTFPTVHGENVVLRLLYKSAVMLGLKELGFRERELEKFNRLIYHPYGIVLVTGPTGSGKSTTLYAALTTLNSMEKNIITVEDPVEYELPLIRQTQVNERAGLTFASGLRAILRQDPDIIMVGEIRDKETAEIAIRAALTGHLVFSTLHTNDAVSALTRLIDMGVEPFLISTTVIGVLAQRLVRVNCPKCKEEYQPSAELLKQVEGFTQTSHFYRGKGCSHCNQTGFMGRIGIFELLVVDDDIRKMVNLQMSVDEIREFAKKQGMALLSVDGMNKVKEGITTLEELLKITTI